MTIKIKKKLFEKLINENSEKIKIRDGEHLKQIIKKEIREKGPYCDLNHLDVSRVIDMSWVFYRSKFNGDISKWDVGNVEIMNYMFSESEFNGDISDWDVSRLDRCRGMFDGAKFNRDISRWDVNNVEYLNLMFADSKFNKDISGWRLMNIKDPAQIDYMFERSAYSYKPPIKMIPADIPASK